MKKKLTFLVQHNEPISLVNLAQRSSWQSILENNLLVLKHHSVEKKCFSWHLDQFFRCFRWKYCAVSENLFSLPVIYLHFSDWKFSLFLWIKWFKFKTRLEKGPISELADWTGFLTKFYEFDVGLFNWALIDPWIWDHNISESESYKIFYQYCNLIYITGWKMYIISIFQLPSSYGLGNILF